MGPFSGGNKPHLEAAKCVLPLGPDGLWDGRVGCGVCVVALCVQIGHFVWIESDIVLNS